MMSIEKPVIVWAWVCPITGMVWNEAWARTEDYATMRTGDTLGKRRMQGGDMKLVRVTVEPLSDAEAAAHRAEYDAGKAAKAAKAHAA